MATLPAQRQASNRQIQERIKRFVIDEGYRPGDPLPPEGELARALGVSRPALREAIKALQPLGVIETRHGTGTFVGRFSLDSLVHGLAFSISIDLDQNLRTVRELLELRETLERAFVARVAAVRTDEQLDELARLVGAMEDRAGRGEIFPEEDRAFHVALYRPLGNVLLAKLLQAFWDIYFLVRDQFVGGAYSPATTAADHRRILDSLAARDAAAAAAAMAEHFQDIQRRLGTTRAGIERGATR
ncbi:MAG TPA: FCD domain-containing protein [Thermomicrobiales bacterium]|jgi:DNA-binding FadR family transcriptional regulator